jgi:hypothetical protein
LRPWCPESDHVRQDRRYGIFTSQCPNTLDGQWESRRATGRSLPGKQTQRRHKHSGSTQLQFPRPASSPILGQDSIKSPEPPLSLDRGWLRHTKPKSGAGSCHQFAHAEGLDSVAQRASDSEACSRDCSWLARNSASLPSSSWLLRECCLLTCLSGCATSGCGGSRQAPGPAAHPLPRCRRRVATGLLSCLICGWRKKSGAVTGLGLGTPGDAWFADLNLDGDQERRHPPRRVI